MVQLSSCKRKGTLVNRFTEETMPMQKCEMCMCEHEVCLCLIAYVSLCLSTEEFLLL